MASLSNLSHPFETFEIARSLREESIDDATDIIPSDTLHSIAFDVLGQELEAVLPYAMVVWFTGLLIGDSRGRTRLIGSAVMAIVVAASIVNIVGPWLNVGVSAPLVLFILPFGWFVLECVKPRASGSLTGQRSVQELTAKPVTSS